MVNGVGNRLKKVLDTEMDICYNIGRMRKGDLKRGERQEEGKAMEQTEIERDIARVNERVAEVNRAVEKYICAMAELRELNVKVTDWDNNQDPRWREILLTHDGVTGKRIGYTTDEAFGVLSDAILDGRLRV